MSRNIILAVVGLAVLVIVGWFFMQPKQNVSTAPTPATTQATPVPSQAPVGSESAMTASQNIVLISSTGYSPKSITVKVGESVSWENTDTENHTVSSDPHPTHELFPFLNLGKIGSGEKKSVIFDKKGTFTYHDHLNPSLKGSVAVE